MQNIEENWKYGYYKSKKISCRSEQSKGVYCLQYDDEKIVSGLRDNTIKVWQRANLECTRVLQGHTGSVVLVIVFVLTPKRVDASLVSSVFIGKVKSQTVPGQIVPIRNQ